MSTLYLSTHIEPLAQRLAQQLDLLAKTGDFFEPTTIVVPHRAVGQWLRLWLARQRGIAMNLRVLFLEASLWEMLRAVDPRPQDPVPELLDGDSYRLLVLNVLTQEPAQDGLEYWQRLLHSGAPNPRLHSRRLWRLADQLASLIRDYEYHRQDALIQHWLRGALGLDSSHRDLELGQQAIFRAITRIPDGFRAKLNEASGRNFKTLPQYAMEVMELFQLEKRLSGKPSKGPRHLASVWPNANFDAARQDAPLAGAVFRLARLSFQCSGGQAKRQAASRGMIQLAQEIRQPDHCKNPTIDGPSRQLLLSWGRAGAESLETMSLLCAEPKAFTVELAGKHADHLESPLFGQDHRDSVLRAYKST